MGTWSQPPPSCRPWVHRELEMSHQYTMGVSTQYQSDAHSMYQCPQESWSMPGVGVSHHCPPAQTLVEMGSGMSAVGPAWTAVTFTPRLPHALENRGNKLPRNKDTEGLVSTSRFVLTCTSRLQPQSEQRSQPLCTPRSALWRGHWGEPQLCSAHPALPRAVQNQRGHCQPVSPR